MAGRRPVAAIIVAITALLMTGCGPDASQDSDVEDTSSAPPAPDPPSADVRCPYEGFSEVYVPQDWTAASIEVCHDTTQSNVLVINVSPVFISVGPGADATLAEWGQADDASFENMVYSEIVAGSATTDAWLIPPGGWVVLEGSPASARVGLPVATLATAYASDKLIGYVQSRLTSPDRAVAQRVSSCATEVGVTIANTQDPSLGLDYLLADATLGAGLQCGPLLRDLTAEAPAPGALQGEFARFRTSVRASAADDLFQAARTFIQVLR